MLSLEEYRRFDAIGLAEAIQRKHVSPAEIKQAVLQLAELQKPTLNALAALFDTEIDRQLAHLQATGLSGPLAGVPMMIKDIGIFLAGTDNCNGGGDFLRLTAPIDSNITVRYRQAGLVIYGKTTTCE